MKRITVMVLLAVLSIGVLAFGVEAADTQNKQIEQSVQLLKEIEGKDGVPALARAMANGRGVVIFPSVLNVAAGVGGLGGDGVVMIKGDDGKWFGPSFARLAGLTAGLQLGVEEVGVVCVINDVDGLNWFTDGKNFKLGADASVVAGPWSADVDTAKRDKAEASVYSYTMAKGVFAGAAIGGSMVEPVASLNKEYWNNERTPSELLTTAATDARVQPLVAELVKLEKMGR